MTNFAKRIIDQLIWDSFTLEELRYIFEVSNEPVFQSTISNLIQSGLVKYFVSNGEPALVRL
jgi:hypothetical protein